LDLSRSLEEARRSAWDALVLFAAPGSSDIDQWALGELPARFSDQERTEISEGCYELLLILSGFAATDQPDRGLKVLEQAARLHRDPTRAYHLRRAACLDRDDPEGARLARGDAERIEPSTPLDHFLTGQEWYHRGDWSRARRHFEAALRLRPDHFWAHCLAAVCCLQMNQPGEAESKLSACLEREPEFAWLYVLRGYTSSLIAARHHQEAARLAPPQANARRTDEMLGYQAAEADFLKASQLLERRPEDGLRYVLLVDRGLMWFQRKELDKAAADLREAVQLNERDFQALTALAKVEQDRGHPGQAIDLFTRAIEAKPDFAPLYRGRADVYLGLQDLTQDQRARALDDLKQAIAHAAPDPVVARDHTNRARLLHDEGRDQEALEACERAKEVAPDYAPACLLRLKILLDLKRDDELRDSCDALLAHGQASPELYELRGLARARLGDYAGAIEDVTEVLGQHPDRTPLLTRRGWLYLTKGAYTLARSDFDRAIELDPGNGDAHDGRGEAMIHLGDHRAAVVDVQSALRPGTRDERLLYNAARIYAQAALAAGAEVRQKGRDAVMQARKYQDRAVELVHRYCTSSPPNDMQSSCATRSRPTRPCSRSAGG
jgi:tetratricopeptide (TPR) repeat protein